MLICNKLDWVEQNSGSDQASNFKIMSAQTVQDWVKIMNIELYNTRSSFFQFTNQITYQSEYSANLKQN